MQSLCYTSNACFGVGFLPTDGVFYLTVIMFSRVLYLKWISQGSISVSHQRETD